MMRRIDVDVPMTPTTFDSARHLALEIAHANKIADPMIVAWHMRNNHEVSPSFEGGGHPESWWEKYGIGNYGELEVSISNSYDFVMTESAGAETLDEIPLRELKDEEGTTFICYTSMLGDSDRPNAAACTPTDEWLAKQT